MKGKKGYIYRIRLSDNMLSQAMNDKTISSWLDDNLREFPDYDKAYYYVIGKWGSGSLNQPLGLQIERKKIGSNKWAFTFGA